MKLLAVVVGLSCLNAQPAEPRTGSLSGRIVNSANSQPVSGADLTLSPVGPGTKLTGQADAQGKFSFESVSPGRYTLQAAKAGFARMSYGAAALGNPGRVLAIVPDRSVPDLEVRLTPLSTIQGKVINRKGDPVPGVIIACGFVDAYGAPPTMEPVRAATDSRGEFRIPDMPPGRYYIQALPPRPELPAFYPSAGTFAEAQPIVVAPGQEASGLTLRLRDVPVFHVKGKVNRGADSPPFSDMDLLLLPTHEGGGPRFGRSYMQAISRPVAGSKPVGPVGTFDLSAVEPGSYELVAATASGRTEPFLGRVAVHVTDRDVEGLVLQLGRLVPVTFRLQPDREVKDASCFLTAYPPDGDPTVQAIMGSTGLDGVFAFNQAMAGNYALAAKCKPEGWAVKSVRIEGDVDGQSVLDTGLNLSGPTIVNLILSADTGVVVATVKEEDAPAPGRWVTLIPDPPRLGNALHEVSGWSDEEGRAALRNVMPGDYRVYAWREATPGASAVNPMFLKRFESQSAKVTVRASQQVQVETKVIVP